MGVGRGRRLSRVGDLFENLKRPSYRSRFLKTFHVVGRDQVQTVRSTSPARSTQTPLETPFACRMKIILDESVPQKLRLLIEDSHTVVTTWYQGWSRLEETGRY